MRRIDDYLARRATREPGLPPIKFVRVDEQSKRYEKTIMAEMQPLVGKPLDLDAGGQAHHRAVRPRHFRDPGLHVGGSSRGAPARRSGLEVRARRKSWGPNYVRFGLNLEDDFQGNSRYNAAARFVLTEINELGAELLTDVQIGSDPKIVERVLSAARCLAHLVRGAERARRSARPADLREKSCEVADFRDREAEADIDVGRISATGARSAQACTAPMARPACASAIRRWWSSSTTTASISSSSATTGWTMCIFPREGQTFSLQWDANRTNLGADVASDRVQADWLMARSRGRNTLLLWTSAGSTLDGNFKPTALPEFLLAGRILQSVGARARLR